jgi:formylmethanofuran dehydrogenase subunit C
MKGGTVLVHGSVGSHAGDRMRRGLVAVGGGAGEYAGCRLIAGTLLVCGSLARGAGLGLKRGTILAGGTVEPLPTFRYACTYRPGYLPLLFRSLVACGFSLPEHLSSGTFRRYGGDFTEMGRGEILQWTAAA